MITTDQTAIEPAAYAIIIPRDSLPEVWADNDAYYVAGDDDEQMGAYDQSPDTMRAQARALLALAEHLDTQPTPLAVGDRVRVVVPEDADGERATALAKGDVGTVMAEADEDGDIRFRRDGTKLGVYVAATNVVRIGDDPPRVGDIVRVDKAERADGGTKYLPEVGKEYQVLSAAGSDGDLVTEQDEYGIYRIVDARNVTVMRRAER